MNRHFPLSTALAVLFACAARAGEAPAAAEACASAGVFTQDVEGALRLSEERDMPLLLAFRGADWCEWCRLADRKVFSQPEWTSWAATNLVLAEVDFPKDSDAQDGAVRARNEALAERFGLEAVPTYVLLAPGAAGTEEIARLAGTRVLTPDAFVGEIRRALRFLDPAFLAERLSPEEASEFETLRARRRGLLAAAEARRAAFREASGTWAARLAEARAADPARVSALEAEAVAALRALAKPDETEEADAFPAERYAQLLEKLK